MSINFGDLLTVEQKTALLEGKIQQLAIEGYQLQINKLAVEKLENNQDALAMLDANMAAVMSALNAYQQELDNIK
jgi:hypothetical protein